MMVMVALASPQRGRQFLERDRSVAIRVKPAEHLVGLRQISPARAERGFEFRLVDLPAAVSVDVREQVL